MVVTLFVTSILGGGARVLVLTLSLVLLRLMVVVWTVLYNTFGNYA